MSLFSALLNPNRPSQPAFRGDGIDIRADVVLGEHDALRLAGGAGGEDDREQFIRVDGL